jgi:hypothetical protein
MMTHPNQTDYLVHDRIDGFRQEARERALLRVHRGQRDPSRTAGRNDPHRAKLVPAAPCAA